MYFSTGVVDMYAKFGKMRFTSSVFDEMPQRTELDVVSEIFDEMPEAKDVVICNTMMDGLCQISLGEWCHHFVKRKRLHKKVKVGTAILDMYSKCGEIEQDL
ncbi:unnamed protein product, partial [Thlaspi arvense]